MQSISEHQGIFSGLEPHLLWRHFAAISCIPRPSKREQEIADYILGWARTRQLAARQDSAGNLVVRVPATHGFDSAEIVVLQSHLDMVCSRNNDTPYDPETGNILIRRDGDWFVAPYTTLGADNGIGIATMLWIGEDPAIPHGPLDLLFTTDEETGLHGAANLDPSLIRGRTLINLDSEEDSVLCIGCAGGTDTTFRWTAPLQLIPPGWQGTQVTVTGLLGGHSGMDIHKNRLNAIKALTQVLRATDATLMLSIIDGGDRRNAIPREASATLFHPASETSTIYTAFSNVATELCQQYRAMEPGVAIAVTPAISSPQSVFSPSKTRQLLDFLYALPTGIVAMSHDLPDLVESSTNLALVRCVTDSSFSSACIEITSLSRSSCASAMHQITATLHGLARLAHASAEDSAGYPGWQPNSHSRLLTIARHEYQRLFQSAPSVTAIHAGLECGLLGQKIPMDMISIGPVIQSPHAPGERVSISSLQKFTRLLLAVLSRLASIPADDKRAGDTPAAALQ